MIFNSAKIYFVFSTVVHMDVWLFGWGWGGARGVGVDEGGGVGLVWCVGKCVGQYGGWGSDESGCVG